jgi:glycosyltransferase involved in cell wall biosynthesis
MDKRACRLVIPAFSEVTRIERCLNAALASPLPAGWSWTEWVLFDDHSDDGTAAAAEAWSAAVSHPPLGVRVSPTRQGKSAALGVWHAKAVAAAQLEDVIVVVDADTAVERGSFAALLTPFDTDPDLAVVWGADRPDDTTFGRWASSFQMEATTALARRRGLRATRAYGRFFAYRVGALTDFSWEPDVTDDTQLANFVRSRRLTVRSEWDATVMVTPAGNYRDFYSQTYRYYQAEAVQTSIASNGSEGRSPAERVSVLASQAIRRPLWAVAYAGARVVASARHRMGGEVDSVLWTPSASTKSAS